MECIAWVHSEICHAIGLSQIHQFSVTTVSHACTEPYAGCGKLSWHELQRNYVLVVANQLCVPNIVKIMDSANDVFCQPPPFECRQLKF